jgi:hypothetical protein
MDAPSKKKLKNLLFKTGKLSFNDIAAFKKQIEGVMAVTNEDEADVKKLWEEMGNELDHFKTEIEDLREEFMDRIKVYLKQTES